MLFNPLYNWRCLRQQRTVREKPKSCYCCLYQESGWSTLACGNGNGNVILFKRSSELVQQAKDRRPKLLTFLRGTKKERKALKREATLYSYFEEIWDVCSRHIVKNLPEQYVLCSFHAFKRAALI